MDKATGKALLVDGKEVTSSVKHTPSKSDDCTEVVFTFDGSGLEDGQELVVFESATYKGTQVATHADINDKAQTVTVGPRPPGLAVTGANGIVLGVVGLALAGLGGVLLRSVRRRS